MSPFLCPSLSHPARAPGSPQPSPELAGSSPGCRGFPSTSVPVSHFFCCRTPQDHAQLPEAWEEQPQPAGCVPGGSATGKSGAAERQKLPVVPQTRVLLLDRAFQKSQRECTHKAHNHPYSLQCKDPRKNSFRTQKPILQPRSCSTDHSHHRSRRELLPGMLHINPLTFSPLSFYFV